MILLWHAYSFRYRGLIASLFVVSLLGQIAQQLFTPALFGLIPAFGLRLWSRRYIGEHSRGHKLAVPQFIVGGPYALMRHPLYVSNGITGVSIAFWWLSLSWQALLWSCVWVFWYAWLAWGENQFLQKQCGAACAKREGLREPNSSWWQAFHKDIWTWFWLALTLFLLVNWRLGDFRALF